MFKAVKIFALLGLLAILSTSCSDDDSYGTLTLSQSAIYLNGAGAESLLSFTTSDIKNVWVYSYPDGWDISINFSKRTIYVTAPDDISDDSDSDLSGTVTLRALSGDGLTSSTTFTVGLADQVDISDQMANSIMINTPNLIYSIDATKTTPEGGSISPSSAGIVWQSYPDPIAYATLDGDKIVFYANYDVDDVDEDGDEEDIVQGNALIAAYDSDDNILWSWHIWVADESYNEISFNGRTLMDRNLGAFTNSNSSSDDIMSSYGLYYQWGRKEPFIYPATYNSEGGTATDITDSIGDYVYIEYESCDSDDAGTFEYAQQNPLIFILGVEESSYDWLLSSHDNTLWSSTKSKYDPCPKGWRVADADAYENVSIPELSNASLNLSDYASSYGWELSDGATTELFMGLGMMNYINGYYQNVYPNPDPDAPYQPWVGNYWTVGSSTSVSNYSSSLYFTFDALELDNNYIVAQQPSPRANAMQIRCQKE